MKDIHFHLPNERIERLESLALVFLNAYKRSFLFLHICPMKVVSCDQWHCFAVVETREAQIMKIVYPVVRYNTF